MNNIELIAARLLLTLTVDEAALAIGNVSSRSWRFWESGRAIPSTVADDMETLLAQRQALVNRLSISDAPALAYYATLEAFQGDYPQQGLIDWRVWQSSVMAVYGASPNYVSLSSGSAQR